MCVCVCVCVWGGGGGLGDGVNVGARVRVRVRVRVRFYACYGPESLLQGTAFQKTILKFLVFSRFYQTNKKEESN